MKTRPPQPVRSGFTLIELLTVIALLGALMALLMVAIGSARESVGTAEVSTEISSLESSITEFSSTYGGSPPPSAIVLVENPTSDTWPPDSVRKLRGIFGTQFKFDKVRDINGDGDTSDVLVLTGPECLVFFLGGVPTQSANPDDRKALTGFSKNPADPFARGTGTRNRFFEFQPSRLVDLDGDGIWEYRDPLSEQTSPYLYVRATPGQGYPDASTTPNDLMLGSEQLMLRVYFQDTGLQTAFKPDGYQIISPGEDGKYGPGGYYNAENAETILTGPRFVEADNITNLKAGKLAN